MDINAMLEKVRKGAVASFREKQIAAVLARLGGSFVEEIADIPVEAQLYGAEHLVADREWRAEKQQDMLRKFGGPLGKPGSVRIVGDFKWGSDGYYTVPCIARVTCFRISLGAHSVLLSPLDRLDKHAADALQWHKLIASPEPEIYKVLQWLDAHGWKERAAAALGVEPHLPGVPRTRANTGTCGVCFANVKLDGGRLVLHGYQRPGDGMAHGRCWGVGHEPFELSPEATRKYTDRGLTPKREAAERLVAELARGGMVLGTEKRPVPPDDPRWPSEWEMAKERAAHALKAAAEDEAAYRRLLQFWKVRPLPREGAPDPQWFYHGQKPDPNDAPAPTTRKSLWSIGE